MKSSEIQTKANETQTKTRENEKVTGPLYAAEPHSAPPFGFYWRGEFNLNRSSRCGDSGLFLWAV